MAKKIALFLLFFCCITGCTTAPHHYTTPPSTRPITKCLNLTCINSIVVSGSAHVVLANGPNTLTLHGSPEDLAISTVTIQNHTLYLTVPAVSAKAVQIKLQVPCLRNITVEQDACVTANNFSSPCLTVKAKDYASINLDGNLGVNKIIQRGAGKIELGWINSCELMIDSSDNGPIYLAGTVIDMLAKLTCSAYLDARYLRAHKVIVIAANSAEAYVLPLKSLSAYAINCSNIYYYKRPEKITVVTRDSGNVLKPDWMH